MRHQSPSISQSSGTIRSFISGVTSVFNLLMGCSLVSMPWICITFDLAIYLVMNFIALSITIFVLYQHWIFRNNFHCWSFGQLIIHHGGCATRTCRIRSAFYLNIIFAISFISYSIVYFYYMVKILIIVIFGADYQNVDADVFTFSAVVVLCFQATMINARRFSEFNALSIMVLLLAFLMIWSLGIMYSQNRSEIRKAIPTEIHKDEHEGIFIQLGAVFSVLSASYGLGIYSFVTFDFNSSGQSSTSQRSFFIFTMVGLCIASLVFIIFGIIINQIATYARFLTFVDVLILIQGQVQIVTPHSVKAFLVLFFFFLVLKTPVHIMLAKRAVFEIMIESLYKGISEEKMVENRMIEESRASNNQNISSVSQFTPRNPIYQSLDYSQIYSRPALIDKIHRIKQTCFYEDLYSTAFYISGFVTLLIIALFGVIISKFPSFSPYVMSIFSLVGGLGTNILEFVIPGLLLLIQWTSFGQKRVILYATIVILAMGLALSVWCSISIIFYLRAD